MKQIILPFGDREGRQPLLMGCYNGDRQVGFNLFIPMDFTHNGKKILGFQSGFASTDPDYRRRGIFNNLQVNARKELEDLGGRFVFGFPGPNSHPLFVKLGFSDYAHEKLFLPRFSGKANWPRTRPSTNAPKRRCWPMKKQCTPGKKTCRSTS